MNKKYLIITLVFLVFVPLFLLVIRPSSTFSPFQKSVTPTPFETSSKETTSKKGLAVVSTNPKNNSLNIPYDSKIEISFNREPKTSEVQMIISPEINGKVSVEGKKLILTPDKLLQPSTNYVVVLGIKEGGQNRVYSFMFYSLGPTPTQYPDTYSPELVTQSENYERQNNPDVFLSNETPYSNSSFSITSAYTNTPSGHFYFSVTFLGANKDTSRSSFITWLKSKEFTDSQIQNLDIRYK